MTILTFKPSLDLILWIFELPFANSLIPPCRGFFFQFSSHNIKYLTMLFSERVMYFHFRWKSSRSLSWTLAVWWRCTANRAAEARPLRLLLTASRSTAPTTTSRPSNKPSKARLVPLKILSLSPSPCFHYFHCCFFYSFLKSSIQEGTFVNLNWNQKW